MENIQKLENLNEFNSNKICRTCLQEKNDNEMIYLYDIESDNQRSIAEIIMSFIKLQIQIDELPQKICNECTKNIKFAYKIKNDIENNEIKLIEYLNSKKEDLKPIIDDIDTFDEIYHTENQLNENELKPEIEDNARATLNIEENTSVEFNVEDNNDEDSEIEANFSKIKEFNQNKNAKSGNPNFEVVMIEKFDKLKKNKKIKNRTNFTECKICNSKFRKFSNLKSHIYTSHQTIESFKNMNLENNEILQKSGRKSVTKFIEFIVSQLKQNKFMKFCSFRNELGDELYLSDSETESENDNNVNDNSDCNSNKKPRYVCEICNIEFDRKYKSFQHQYIYHLQDEQKEKKSKDPYLCEHCKRKFKSEKLYLYHLKIQCKNKNRVYKCDHCDKSYYWKKNLVRHSKIKHSIGIMSDNPPEQKKFKRTIAKRLKSEEKKISCQLCERTFARIEHLNAHLKSHNPENQKYECSICHKKFNRKILIKTHLKIHGENEQLESFKNLCIYCGQRFSSSSNLTIHLRRHTGEKPFKCDVCGKGFPRKTDLTCHIRIHTGEKPCLCTICGKRFDRSNKLKRHVRIHTGDKPYKCTYCDRAFTQSNDLTLHIRRHTGEKPYVCGICGERYFQKSTLQTHRRSKGHFEDDNKTEKPLSRISVNYPNRTNILEMIKPKYIPINEEDKKAENVTSSITCNSSVTS